MAEHGGTIHYEYTVSGRTFITKTPLCDFKADCAEGRSTRVWTVYEKNQPLGAQFALKDIWMMSDSTTEGTILRGIRSRLEEDQEKYFLTIEADEIAKIGEIDDNTHFAMMRGGRAPEIIAYLDLGKSRTDATTRQLVEGSTRLKSVGHLPSADRLAPQHPPFCKISQFTSRAHYRIVFNEICTPLHELDSPYEIYELLIQAVKGTSYGHSFFFHR
jgi:hypothetical protein